PGSNAGPHYCPGPAGRGPLTLFLPSPRRTSLDSRFGPGTLPAIQGRLIMFSREKNGTVLPKASRSGPPGLSFIGPQVLVSGQLATDAQLHVDGRIDGHVRCSQLVQGEAGLTAGHIHAAEAR